MSQYGLMSNVAAGLHGLKHYTEYRIFHGVTDMVYFFVLGHMLDGALHFATYSIRDQLGWSPTPSLSEYSHAFIDTLNDKQVEVKSDLYDLWNEGPDKFLWHLWVPDKAELVVGVPLYLFMHHSKLGAYAKPAYNWVIEKGPESFLTAAQVQDILYIGEPMLTTLGAPIIGVVYNKLVSWENAIHTSSHLMDLTVELRMSTLEGDYGSALQAMARHVEAGYAALDDIPVCILDSLYGEFACWQGLWLGNTSDAEHTTLT